MKLKTYVVYENILSNLVNGNLSDYKEQINELSPYELVQFINNSIDYGYDIDKLKLIHYLKVDTIYTESLENELE